MAVSPGYEVCRFPELDYKAYGDRNGKAVPLPWQGVSRMMVHLVRERAHFIPRLDHAASLEMLEEVIRGWVDRGCANLTDGCLQQVFHLVQIWGGEHGRYIYVQGPAFDWEAICPHYRRLVEAVLQWGAGREVDEVQVAGLNVEAMSDAAKAFNEAMKVQGRRLGISFITKHVHFWSCAVCHDREVPIFDRFLAQGLGVALTWRNLAPYWRDMYRKADAEGLRVSALERELFICFRREMNKRNFDNDRF